MKTKFISAHVKIWKELGWVHFSGYLSVCYSFWGGHICSLWIERCHLLFISHLCFKHRSSKLCCIKCDETWFQNEVLTTLPANIRLVLCVLWFVMRPEFWLKLHSHLCKCGVLSSVCLIYDEIWLLIEALPIDPGNMGLLLMCFLWTLMRLTSHWSISQSLQIWGLSIVCILWCVMRRPHTEVLPHSLKTWGFSWYESWHINEVYSTLSTNMK